MKANEIQIGDWVMVNDIEHTHPLQVAEIFKKCGAYYATLYWDGMPDNVNPKTLTADVDKVLPIPLTPEILEKNGFKHNEIWHNSFRDIENYHFDIQYGYNGKVDSIRITELGEDRVIPSEKSTMYLTHIHFVHELQHAMRLCGIEIKIEI